MGLWGPGQARPGAVRDPWVLPNSSFGSQAAHGTWHTPPLAGGGPAGVCGGWGAHPQAGPGTAPPCPLPRTHSRCTRPQPSSCTPAHRVTRGGTRLGACGPEGLWHTRARIHTSWPGGRRHLLPCALLDGLTEGRHVESPPTTPARTGWHNRSSHVSAHAGAHAYPHAHAAPFLRQPHLDHPRTWLEHTPPLLHLTLVRRARRYANTPARSVPTHWHTALLICTRWAHPGTHTRVPSAGRQAGGPRTGRPNAPHGRLSACPSTRGSAVVNDAFDGGRICCARSERAPIIWKAEIRNTIYSAALWKQFPNPVQPHSRAASGSRADNDWLFIIFAGNKD